VTSDRGDGRTREDRSPDATTQVLADDQPTVGTRSRETTPGHLPPPPDDREIIVDRDLALERQEHANAVGRMRRLMPLACALWIGFVFVDWVLATFVVPGPLLPYVLLRLLGLLPLIGATWRLRRQPIPSPFSLRLLDGMMTASCAAALSEMCLLSGGLTSPYASYIALVMVGRAAALPGHWKSGAVALGVPLVMYPIVLGLAALVRPDIAAQFGDGIARGTSFFYLMLLMGAWILLVIGGHNVWALRRQLFRSRSIGRYRLVRRIGRGGMGEVWIAYHEQLARDVALKILRPEYGTDPIAVARFEREVMTTAGLRHPNTVRIYDHGTTEDGLWYYAMELLEGRDLSTIVREDGPMPAARAIHLVRQAARALAEAHAIGVVHRDVKPENVFVATLGGERDYVKLLDFGIARAAQVRDARLTTTGWVAGTPAYVSPEAARGEAAEAPADVYGLGMVLYWAVAGTLPFLAETPLEMLAKQVGEAPVPPSAKLGAAVPPAVEAIVLRCLAKHPTDRYPDAATLAAALDEVAIALPWPSDREVAPERSHMPVSHDR
jgi:serine/threonine-protein kinase